MITLNWTDFKSLVDSTSSSIYHVELTNNYRIYTHIAGLNFQCILDKTDAASFESTYKVNSNKAAPVSTISPFANKVLGKKKLFKRVHGIKQSCVVGENIFLFSIPYNNCKITGIELIWGSEGDTCELEVYDTPTGTISGIPNYKLNQFGYTVNVSANHYEHKSEYDADLIKDMVLEVHYNSTVAKVIGVNFILNEVK